KTVKSKVGDRVALPCCKIPSSESLQNYRVYWQKTTMEVVLAYDYGEKISRNEQYDNRTEMDGRNLTLWISPVEIRDNGSYDCVVQHRKSSQNPVVLFCVEHVTLFVTADFSKPDVTAEVAADSCESTEVLVTCSSHGGFVKPRISGALNNKSVVWAASWVSASGLSTYSVTAKLWLNVTKDSSFTCSVEYNGLVRSTSLLLNKTNDCIILPAPARYNIITASTIIIVLFLLAVTLTARCLPRRACCRCCKPHDPVEEGMKDHTKAPPSSKATPGTSAV
ncbi:CD80 protein, partial [Rhinopomastus cyanomelas]|nr:CD80 protein [Rhinopomastus cyanomelas]